MLNTKYCDIREHEIMKSVIVPNEIIKIIYSYDFDFEGKITRTFNGHRYPIVFIEQLSDGRILSYDAQKDIPPEAIPTNEWGNLIIWNIDTGISEITIPIQIYIGNILIMKNNHIACIDIKNNLIIFDPNTGNKLYEKHFFEEASLRINFEYTDGRLILQCDSSNNDYVSYMVFNPKTKDCEEFFRSGLHHIDEGGLENHKYILKVIENFSYGNLLIHENNISTLINLDNDLYFEIPNNDYTKIIDLLDGNIIIYDDHLKIFESKQKRMISLIPYPKEYISHIFMHPNGNLMCIIEGGLKVIDLSSAISTSTKFKDIKINNDVLILPNGNIFLDIDNCKYIYDIQNKTLNRCVLAKYTNPRIKLMGCLINNQIVLEKYYIKSHNFIIELFDPNNSSNTVLMKYMANTELKATEIKIINNRKILYGLKNGTILVME